MELKFKVDRNGSCRYRSWLSFMVWPGTRDRHLKRQGYPPFMGCSWVDGVVRPLEMFDFKTR